MNFDFSEDQYAFQEVLARALSDNFPLQANLADDKTRSARMWSALGELGLFALLVPEEHGGLSLNTLDLALPMEEMGKAVAPLGVAHTLAVTDVLSKYGTQKQKEEILPVIAEGKAKIVIASQEENAGYDFGSAAALTTVSSLHSVKLLVPDAADADFFLVVARTAAGKPALFLIERGRSGVVLSGQETVDPAAAFHRCLFDGVKISESDLIGAPAPEQAAARLFDVCATFYSGLATGAAAKLLALSVAYAAQRVQFGQAIGAFQAIKHKCADMAVAVEAARSAAYYAFWAAAEDASDRAKASSMAKAFCGDAARDAANEAIQVHGGMGFTWELGLHNYLRRIKTLEYAFGDSGFHRERVISETLAAMSQSRSADKKNAV